VIEERSDRGDRGGLTVWVDTRFDSSDLERVVQIVRELA